MGTDNYAEKQANEAQYGSEKKNNERDADNSREPAGGRHADHLKKDSRR
jgi:hypothetical protein